LHGRGIERVEEAPGIAPRFGFGRSWSVGPRTLGNMLAAGGSSALPILAPAAWNSLSGMCDMAPAPASTTSWCLPLAASFLTVSGVAATRVSPARVSRGMPMIMVSAPLAANAACCGSYLATVARVE